MHDLKWNQSLEIALVRADYERNRRIAIPNFLRTEDAEDLYNSFATLAEHGLWCGSELGEADGSSYRFQTYPLRNYPTVTLPEARLPESHPLWRVASFFDSAKVHRLMTSISGHRLKSAAAICFASRYLPGHYLSAHDDGPAPPRRLAYVLNLSKGWLPNWGGNLEILGPRPQEVLQTYPPAFNTLVLFDVPLSHAVSEVASHAELPRYAIAGWYLAN